jgi:hypothetical protein
MRLGRCQDSGNVYQYFRTQEVTVEFLSSLNPGNRRLFHSGDNEFLGCEHDDSTVGYKDNKPSIEMLQRLTNLGAKREQPGDEGLELY